MIELLTSPEAWAALLTLTALEIVLGIDNVVFISILVTRLDPEKAKRARQIGLSLAFVFRIMLLMGLTWIMGLTAPVFTILGNALSWRDLILIARRTRRRLSRSRHEDMRIAFEVDLDGAVSDPVSNVLE